MALHYLCICLLVVIAAVVVFVSVVVLVVDAVVIFVSVIVLVVDAVVLVVVVGSKAANSKKQVASRKQASKQPSEQSNSVALFATVA